MLITGCIRKCNISLYIAEVRTAFIMMLSHCIGTHVQAAGYELHSGRFRGLWRRGPPQEKHRTTGFRQTTCGSKVTGAAKPVECRVLFIEILECGQRRGLTFRARGMFLFFSRRCASGHVEKLPTLYLLLSLVVAESSHQTPGEGKGGVRCHMTYQVVKL